MATSIRNTNILLVLITSCLFLTPPLWAKELPQAKAEKVGMSSERLLRINEVIQRHIEDGRITGAVTAVARRGQVVHFQAHGVSNVEANMPMATDAIFRMASSTKPVTGVAVLMLMEEGKIRLNDPLHYYIPEFKDMQVAVLKEGARMPTAAEREAGRLPEFKYIPAERQITIRDLMTHTSGILSGGLGAMVSDVERQPGDTLKTYIPRLGNVALDFQPGSQWTYSPGAGIDILARVVEVVSGKSFDVFLRDRIFTPLDMKDTYFNLPEEKQVRLLPLYRRTGEGWESSRSPAYRPARSYFSGAGGLVSTARDYLRFEQMLVNGGELDGNRLLSPRTVELMGSNFVGDLYGGFRGDQEGRGFGLTVQVMLDNISAGSGRANGSFGWGGAFGTMSWTDPKEDIAAVIMLQQREGIVQTDFEWAIRQAIIE